MDKVKTKKGKERKGKERKGLRLNKSINFCSFCSFRSVFLLNSASAYDSCRPYQTIATTGKAKTKESGRKISSLVSLKTPIRIKASSDSWLRSERKRFAHSLFNEALKKTYIKASSLNYP